VIEKSGGEGTERTGGRKRRRRRRRRKVAMRTNGQAACRDSRSGGCGSAELLQATVCGPCDLSSLSVNADMHTVHGLAHPKECSLSCS